MKCPAPAVPARAPGLHIHVRDVLGVEDVALRIEPGDLNVIEGRGGVGKTSTLLAILAALTGRPEDIEPRDGADMGVVSITADGEDAALTLVLPAAGKPRTAGDIPVSVSDVRALSVLITGDNAVTPETRNKARIKAFGQLVRAPLTEEAVGLLTEYDPELGAWLFELAASTTLDILGAATALQKRLQELARLREGEARERTGEKNAAARQHVAACEALLALGVEEGPLAEPDSLGAEAVVRDLTGKLALARQGAARRIAEEERRQKLAASHGEEPSVAAEEDALAEAQAAKESAESAEAEALQGVAAAEQGVADVQPQVDAARAKLTAAKRAWETSATVLHEAIEPGDDGEVDFPTSELISHVRTALDRLEETIADGVAVRAAQIKAGKRLAAVKAEAEGAGEKRRDAARAYLAQEQALKLAQARCAAWQTTADLLSQPIEGETPADVLDAEQALFAAEHSLRVHQLSALAAGHQARAQEAGDAAEKAAARGEDLRARNASVPARVADCLAKVGAGGFTVVGGMLAYRQDGGEPIDFDSRMSPSMKTRAALDLAADKWRGFVVLDPVWVWTFLDDEGRAFLRDYAKSRVDLLICVEHATAGAVRVAAQKGGAS